MSRYHPEKDETKPEAAEYVENIATEQHDIHNGEGLRSQWEDVSAVCTIRTFKKAVFICVAAGFTAACDGYQIGINGNVIANPGFIQVFGNQVDSAGNTILSASTLSAFSAMISTGQILGMLGMPFIMDRYGRKTSMYIYLGILALSVLFESVATNWQLWLVGKLFAGIGVGCMQLTLPTYIAEIAPYKIRGSMIALYNIWWSVGGLFAPVALHVLSKSDPTDWKTPIYSQWGLIGAMAIIYIFVIPESHWWAASAGQHERGKRLLQNIHGGIKGYDVEREYAILERTVSLEKAAAQAAKNESFTAIFKGVNGKRTLAAMWTLLGCQFLGLALIGTYITYFFGLAGRTDPFQVTIISSCVGLISVIVTLLGIDKLGRYWCLNGGMSLCWITLIAIGGVSLVPGDSTAKGNGLVALGCLWTFGNNVNFTAGWAMMAEVPSVRLRAKTAGFAAACSALAGLTFVIITPYLINENNANWGLKTCFFFFGTGAPFAIGGWFVLPETKSRSPAALDELFENKVKPWRFARTVTQVEINRDPNSEEEPAGRGFVGGH